MAMKMAWIPAPLSGQNFVANPLDLKPDEARQIENYYVYDWGIRQRGIVNNNFTFNGSGDSTVGIMIPFLRDSSGTPFEDMLISTDKHLYRIQAVDASSPTDVTPGGGFTINAAYQSATIFNGTVVLVNGTDKGIVYTIQTGTAAVATSTPDMSSFTCVWNYKNRLYGAPKGTATYYYGEPGFTTGTFKLVDITLTLGRGGVITWGTSWSVNQGLVNEELMVIGFSSGEIQVYSGDYPGAGNWQMINRVYAPLPLGLRPAFNFGQDILISTYRGIIALTEIIAQKDPSSGLFILSKALGADATGPRTHMALNTDNPFLYAVASNAAASLALVYVQNFERGAWSQLKFYLDTGSGETTVTSIGFYQHRLFIGTNKAKLYNVDNADGEQPSVIFAWKTPYFDFGTRNEKTIKMVRAISRCVVPSETPLITNTIYIAPDFREPSSPVTSTRSTTVTSTDTDYYVQELAPPGVGRFLSLVSSKIAAGEINDIAGLEVYYEEGGVY